MVTDEQTKRLWQALSFFPKLLDTIFSSFVRDAVPGNYIAIPRGVDRLVPVTYRAVPGDGALVSD
jgi:hypothetical protein